MPRLAPHIPSVPLSGIRKLFELALRLDDVTYLAVGEPDVPVAPHIIRAATEAWAADDTNYGPNGGIAPLRAAIVDKLARDNGVEVDEEQIWVTVGGTQALYQAMTLTLAAGDEVLVPDPGYTTFTMNARMLEAVPVPYSLRPDRGFLPDLDELERLVTDRTRVLIVNSPSNPLGVVFPRAVLEELLAFARRHDLWIISDEVYEYFSYGREHVSLARLAQQDGTGDDRVFGVFSLSKTYAMTGIRVGYLVTPKGLSTTMQTVQEASISCVATPDQRAALAAITGPQDAVAAARDHYAANLRLATGLLDDRGIRYREPEGAFYLWIDMSHVTRGDVASWVEEFLLATRVAVAPGRAFGRTGEGWIRVCLAADPADLEHGLRALPAPGDAGPSGATAGETDAEPPAAVSRASVLIRRIDPSEYAFVAQQRLAAYRLEYDIGDDYAAQILDVATHDTIAEVWVAVDASEPAASGPGTSEPARILGSVTVAAPGTNLTPLGREGELDWRLLATDPDARGRGVGRLLTEWVVEQARARGLERVVMNSGTEMRAAHRLYESMGFARMPDRENPPGIEPSRSYGLEL